MLNGSGAPSSGTGTAGDFYLDTAASRLYGPKVGSSWGSGVSLIGPQGTTGATGATGPQGATGPAGADATYSNTTPQALAATASAGTANSAARADHAHQMPTAADVGALPTTFTASTIAYGATADLNMAALVGGYQTISLTGNITFTTSNRASGRTVTIRLICDATQRSLTFPAGWVFIGTKPSNIAASKTAVLSLSFFGTADTDCVAAYGVQA